MVKWLLVRVKILQFEMFGSKIYINKRAMMALGRSPEYHWNQII